MRCVHWRDVPLDIARNDSGAVAEVESLHDRIGRDLGNRSLRHETPGGEHAHAIAQCRHETEVVLHEHDGQSGVAQAREDRAQRRLSRRAEPRRRLVEEKHARAGGESARDLQQPLFGAGELLGGSIGGIVQTDESERLASAPHELVLFSAAGGRPEDGRDGTRPSRGFETGGDVLQRRQSGSHCETLERSRDAGACVLGRPTRDRRAVEGGRAGVGVERAAEHA